MSLKEIKDYIDSFINYERTLGSVPLRKFKLDRVQHLLSLLGDPHKGLRCIHVAGSKGKGSTCSFAAHILKAAGYRVGLYTSPHIRDFRERIRLLTQEKSNESRSLFSDVIPEHALLAIVNECKPAFEAMRTTNVFGRLSYFEVLTALAFVYFKRSHSDVVVLETGLGGRLDATNVVTKKICGITAIDLEHTQQLGKTIRTIAKEKAAIINSAQCQVIVAPQQETAEKVIRQRCQKLKATGHYLGKDIHWQPIRHDMQGQEFYVEGFKTSYRLETHLLGPHQMINAACAIGMVEVLDAYGLNVAEDAIVEGIKSTVLPGRFEIVGKDPYLILDSAHSPDSSYRLAQTIQTTFPDQKVVLVIGLSADKDQRSILDNLAPLSREIIVTQAQHSRARKFSKREIKNFKLPQSVIVTDNIADAVAMAKEHVQEDDIVVVTGSIYLIGEARDILDKEGVLTCIS